MHESFFPAVRELYSLCDSERDAAKARTGGNLRGEHAILSPAIEREERSRARGLSLTRSDGFSKNFRPGPSSLLSLHGERKEGRSEVSARKSQQRTELTFAVASLSRGGGPRVHSGARPG